MPQKLTQKVVNSFNAGLVTEFSELKFPENASVDELNCNLSRDGSRSRRLGLELESGAVESSFNGRPSKVFHTGTWANAGGLSGYNLTVLQVGYNLKFYVANRAPFSAQNLGLNIDIRDYAITSGSPGQVKCQFTSLSGILVVASEAIETFYLTLDNTTNTLTGHRIAFRVRDFEHQSDLTTISDYLPVAGSQPERWYDSKNAGWVDARGNAALDAMLAFRNMWPPLSHPWYSGKDSSGEFSIAEWERIYGGTSIVSNGHYILDFFNKNRADASGIPGLTPKIEPSRFRTVTSYAGRVWYAGLGSGSNSGSILYSRIIESIKVTEETSALGDCFQQNDPTSEDFSDLLDTDGGVLVIPEASNIKKIYAADQYLYVFAENGVWVVGGVQSTNSNTARFVSRNFSASGYFVAKVSSTGLDSPESFVPVEGVPFWWSRHGIHTFSFDQSSGMPVEENLSLTTIQTFWDRIPLASKQSVQSCYDSRNKRVYWMHKASDDSDNRYSNILILDIPLKAFYPWSLGRSESLEAWGLYAMEGYSAPTAAVLVTNSEDEAVVDSTSEEVTANGFVSVGSSSTTLIAYLFNDVTNKITVGTFTSLGFKDFATVNYQSYAVAGYDFFGDLERRKTAPYLTVYCRATEQGFSGTMDVGYTPINESSLLVSALWDYKETSYNTQQAYRVKPYPLVDSTDLSNNQQDRSVVTTRLKIRGRGRSCRFKFESEEGKNFVLLGYGVVAGVNNAF
jgi:hypothetical protein